MPKNLIMKRETILIVSIITLLGCSAPLFAKEYIIKPRQTLKNYDLKSLSIYTNSSIKVTDSIDDLNLIKVSLGEKADPSVDEMGLLAHYFEASYIVENIKLYVYMDTSDPRRAEQWALDKVKAEEAWRISAGSKNVVVAVVDTGINVSHEDLRANLWTNPDEIADNGIDDDNNGYIDDVHGWDFNANDKDPDDETSTQNPGHGTHCAGIIGAVCQNQLGICGMSPTVSLMAVRFLGSDGSGDLFAAVKAIDYAMNNGASIISASFGAGVPKEQAQPMIDAIIRAEEKGVIFVAAAGNEGSSNDTTSIYPANTESDNMISVAASNLSDQKPFWSNFGRKVSLAAPGENILSTVPGGYDELSGTSMATPLVAGVVALMKSLDITLTGAQARSILQSNGQAVSIETASGRRVDAEQALQAVADKKLTVVPATLTIAPNGQFKFSAWGGQPPYRFSSNNDAIATIDEDGNFAAKSLGDVEIAVTDSANTTAKSVSIKVAEPPKDGYNCPFKDEMFCIILCAIDPSLPWCHNLPKPPNDIPTST